MNDAYASVKLKDEAGRLIAWVTIHALANQPDILIWQGRHFRPEAYDWEERNQARPTLATRFG